MTAEQIASPAAPAVSPLVAGLTFAAGPVLMNVQGITDAESRTHPIPGAASPNWILGHLLTVRHLILGQFGVEPVFADAGEYQVYNRGASGTLAPDEGLPFEELVALFSRLQERMIARLKEMTPEQFAETVTIPVPAPHPGPLGELLSLLLLHDSYHAGQLGLMRRALGKEGAIR